MSKAVERRLARLEQLEQKQPTTSGKGHWIIGKTNEELDAREAEVRASAEWQEGDTFTRWRIVAPPGRAAPGRIAGLPGPA
jgi:hypothetical protein